MTTHSNLAIALVQLVPLSEKLFASNKNEPLTPSPRCQMTYFGGEGAVFKEQIKINVAPEESYIVRTEFINDFENDAFNNAYYKAALVE